MTGLKKIRGAAIPDRPGVYIFKGKDSATLYIGKAKSLKRRISSYINSKDEKTRKLVKEIESAEFTVTAGEVEALLLECTLIKERRPKYNVLLRDDKSFPFIALMTTEDYPRIAFLRNPPKDENRYFGPFPNTGAAKETIDLLRRLFPLRTCRGPKPGKRSGSPCLNFHIKRCLAPCAVDVSREEYARMVKGVEDFLNGNFGIVLKSLKKSMADAAGELKYEQAALFRDRLDAVKKVMEKQRVVHNNGDLDAIGIFFGPSESCVTVIFVRGGRVIGRESLLMSNGPESDEAGVVESFLVQFYSGMPSIPRKILLPLDEAVAKLKTEVLEKVLTDLNGEKVSLLLPKRGEKRAIVEMASSNARFSFDYLKALSSSKSTNLSAALDDLKEKLALKKLPWRIECYDVSTLMGTDTVGSMVIFEGGKPVPDKYRRFKVSEKGEIDDVAALAGVLTRRLKGSPEKFGKLPDLIVVDGGLGQQRAAQEVVADEGHDVTVVGLAKRNEDIYLPGTSEPLELDKRSQAIFLMQRIRDEAHRFAISYHKKLRGKSTRRSTFDDIPGIGEKRKKALIKSFGSVRGVKGVSVEELKRVEGISDAMARRIFAYFHEE